MTSTDLEIEFRAFVAGTADAEVFATIHKAAFERPWRVLEFQRFLENDRCTAFKVVQNRDGVVCAFVVARFVEDEAEILTIAVLPLYQRRGFGSLLLQTVIEWLRDQQVETLFLEVSEKNEAALKLYQNAGFLQIGRRRGYYPACGAGDSADCLTLRLMLKSAVQG